MFNDCSAASCGDGFVQAGVEDCDDSNTEDGDLCASSCTVATCGDGVLQSDEECDDGNVVASDGCSADCLFEDSEGGGYGCSSNGGGSTLPLSLLLSLFGLLLLRRRSRQRVESRARRA